MKKILIVLGSKSDSHLLEKLHPLYEFFGVEYITKIISAHRAPSLLDKVLDEINTTNSDDIGVVIAVAGLSAHLPGVVASKTVLPVIGVPVSSKPLMGIDAVFSILQMPSGVPVATVGIDNIKNAYILAIKMLSIFDKTLQNKLVSYMKNEEQKYHDYNK